MEMIFIKNILNSPVSMILHRLLSQSLRLQGEPPACSSKDRRNWVKGKLEKALCLFASDQISSGQRSQEAINYRVYPKFK